VTTPDVETRATRAAPCSVSHRAPSGPAVIPKMSLVIDGIATSTIEPSAAIRPSLLPVAMCSAIQTAASGPDDSASESVPAVGIGNSATVPAVVTRPTRPDSGIENQRFPSGPGTI